MADSGKEKNIGKRMTWVVSGNKRLSGDSEAIRTPDRRLRRPLLYPAELPSRNAIIIINFTQVFVKEIPP